MSFNINEIINNIKRKKLRIKSPNDLIRSMPKKYIYTFLCAFIMSLIVHICIYTKLLPNHDGLYFFSSNNDILSSGRWLLTYASKLSTHFYLPWCIGIINSVLFGFISIVLVYLFNIENKFLIFALSMIVVADPCITNLNFYLFTSDAYLISCLMAILAVVITTKRKNGFIVGGILLGVSLGIYQAYIGVVVLLCTLVLISKLLFDNINFKDIMFYILRYIFLGIIGVLFYLIGLKIRLAVNDVSLISYQGINSFGQLGIGVYIQSIFKTYIKFIGYFTKNDFYYNWKPMWYVISNILLFSSSVVIIITYIIKSKLFRDIKKLVLLIFLILVVPCMALLSEIMAPTAYKHLLMFPQLFLVTVFFIYLLDKYIRDLGEKCKNNKYALTKWVAIVVLCPIMLHHFLLAQISYLYLEKTNDYLRNDSIKILDRIEQIEGYNENTEIYFVGNYSINTNKELLGDVSVSKTTMVYDNATWYYWLKDYMGKFYYIYYGSDEETIKSWPEYKEMTHWPQKGSVKMINDVIIVNF